MGYSDALDAPDAEAWISKSGDKLIGMVIDRDTRTGGTFGDYEIVTVEVTEPSTEDGGSAIEVGAARAVHCFGTILSDRVEKLNPREGDVIGFKNNGVSDKAKPGQSPAKLYKVKLFSRAELGYEELEPEPVQSAPEPVQSTVAVSNESSF